MLIFPQAKINLGLNIVERRPDGYHNLETVFYPVPLCDAIEVQPMDSGFPSKTDCDLKVSGISVEGDEQSNLVVRAYQLLKNEFPQLPRLHIHLHKAIPTQAGMGGGSSDAASMLVLLNRHFQLRLTSQQLIDRATQLGADCPFFIMGTPAYAEGIGERLQPLSLSLKGWWLAIVKPPVSVSTREAFARITPQHPDACCRDIVGLSVEQWQKQLVNDFEASVFAQHPQIGQVKEQLLQLGAVYSAMSGSGSAVFGLFCQQFDVQKHFPKMFTAFIQL